MGRELGVDDGAGVNGPLDGTMSIECLRFIKTEMIRSQRIAILIDDRNKLYRVSVGSSIGRPSGLIKAITAETIFYYHYYKDKGGSWHEIVRELHRHN